MSLISIENVSVIREDKTILDGVSLTVGKHDFITIIGPNGAGKTTLLHVLLGLVAPTNGIVNKSKNLKISYIPQSLHIDVTMPLTVSRFIKLASGINYTAIPEMLERLEIPYLYNNFIANLSGGEFQRVLLARALLQNPDILLLDEPAKNLDISGQLAFYKMLEQVFKQRQCSIVMVSHDIHLVMASSSHVLCLFHHVCCSGEPNHVTKDPKFQELFGEDMVKMMSVYHHEHMHSHLHSDNEADAINHIHPGNNHEHN